MNKELINKLIQKSICINSGFDDCHSPYSCDEEWYKDIDLLIQEYLLLHQKYNQALKILEKHLDAPCNLANFDDDEYCEKHCEDNYLKCWDRYIEQKVKENEK